MPFTHLHTHSHFSLLEGVPAPDVLAARAAQFKMPALALTDHNALYGLVPFYQACHTTGVQPILGLELDTEEGDRLVLLARDFSGYRSLCRLASAVQLGRPTAGRRPGCPLDLLQAERTGLLALSGGQRSLIARLWGMGWWRSTTRSWARKLRLTGEIPRTWCGFQRLARSRRRG
jgi:DNA polymerase III alpha subunit